MTIFSATKPISVAYNFSVCLPGEAARTVDVRTISSATNCFQAFGNAPVAESRGMGWTVIGVPLSIEMPYLSHAFSLNQV